MEDDYFVDDDEALDEEGYYNEDVEEEEDENPEVIEEDETNDSESEKYSKLLTPNEIDFISKYDDIVAVGKNANAQISDAFTIIVSANPAHTTPMMVGNIVMEAFNRQGHNRMTNSAYTPETQLTGRDVDVDFLQEDDMGLNEEITNAAREQIARFVEYLSTRDLSKDSTVAKKVKQRQLPAFIIFLFSSKMGDLIINCPTLPEEYAKQVNTALKRIEEMRREIIESLAKRYEEAGRPKVASRVRKMQRHWFSKEPAEIKTAADYSDLNLTAEDISLYREYRSKFKNVSDSLTQDVISDLIEVNEGEGIYRKLKDKTRAAAIEDVKQLYSQWSKENPVDEDLAKKIIWKKFEKTED